MDAIRICHTFNSTEIGLVSRYTTVYDVDYFWGSKYVWYGMTFSSTCADVQVPRDGAIHLWEPLEACQTRNGKLQLFT